MKQIEESFNVALGTTSVHITARSYNCHLFLIAFKDGDKAEGCMSIKEMRKLSDELLKIADHIEKDEDFNKIKT